MKHKILLYCLAGMVISFFLTSFTNNMENNNRIKKIIAEKKDRLNKDYDEINNIIKDLSFLADDKKTDAKWCAIANYEIASLLINKYYSNSYSINNRSILSDTIPEDIDEWSKNIYQDAVYKRFNKAIKASDECRNNFLKEISSYYNDSTFNKYPVNEAIRLQIINTFSTNLFDNRDTDFKDKDIFSPVEKFTNLNFASDNKSLNTLKLKLYQYLLNEYKDKKDDNFIYINIARLNFCNNINPDNTLLRTALEKFNKEFVDTPQEVITFSYLYENILENSSNSQKDIECITDGYNRAKYLISKYPELKQTKVLKEFCDNYERVGFSLNFNEQQNSNTPFTVNLKYKNCKEITIYITENNKVIKKYTHKLEDKITFSEYSKDIIIDGLGYGKYSLKAEITPIIDKKYKKDDLSQSKKFYISDIAVVTKVIDNANLFFVTNSKTGKPLNGAKVKIYLKNNNKAVWLTTNEDGFVSTKDLYTNFSNKYLMFDVTYKDDIYFNSNNIYSSSKHKDFYREYTSVLTDRSVYRPGQVVYYKVICYAQQEKKSNAVTNKTLDVEFLNSNREVIAKQSKITDGFGAIYGEFTIPKNTLNGNYYIQTYNGSASISVSEYKRPTFEISINKPTSDYAAGDTISLSGNVKTFSGAALGDCNLKYIVSKGDRWGWNKRQILSGKLNTNEDGDFTVSFKSEENDGEDTNYYGYDSYVVEIVCETLSGEVQSESVNVLTKGKSIDFSFNWKNPGNRSVFSPFSDIYYLDKDYSKSIEVNTTNNSYLPLKIKGVLKLFKYSADELFNTDAADSTYSFVKEYDFESGKDVKLGEDLSCGIYKFVAQATDSKGRVNTGEKIVIVYSLKEKQMPGNIAYWMVVDGVKCKYLEESNIFLGSSLEKCYVLKGVAFSNDKVGYDYKINIISNEVVKFSNTFIEEYGDNYQFSFVFIKDNEVYDKACVINRVKDEYSIIFKRESFRDKLLPGAKEKWKFTLFNNNEKVNNGQVVANMYDESLDKIKGCYWYFYPAPYSYYNYRGWDNNLNRGDVYIARSFPIYISNEYIGIHRDISANYYLKESEFAVMSDGVGNGATPMKRGFASATKSMNADMVEEEAVMNDNVAMDEAIQNNEEANNEEIKDVTIRTNLNETAFFYPNLLTDKDGNISIEFTTPESLTRWKLMMLAHTPDMKFGMHTERIVTEKDFMVMPNIPRFCRQDDKVGYSALIINKKEEQQSGDAVIELFNPYNDEVLHKEKVAFNVKGNSSTSVTFLADTPQSIDILGVRIIAGNKEFSDGEQKVIPILPSKTLVTESMIMNIRGKENKTYNFANYLNNNSKTLENYRYSVQFTGNPAWYVVQALPALSEFKFPCASDATASYYVTSLATHIAKSDIGIKKAIDLWKAEGKDGETLVSNLEKNEELKQILLAESPCVMEAKNESENMQALSQLFNVNRQDNIKKTAIDMLVSLQNSDGGIAWFKGMKSSAFQTINTLTNFARLRKLGVKINDDRVVELEKKAIKYTDKTMLEWYEESLKYYKKFTPSYAHLLWVYCRSFYKNISMEKEVEKVYREVIKYYGNYKTNNLYEAAILSLTLRRNGENAKANKVNKLILKRMSKSDEMGYYWANNRSAYWNSAVQTHVALMAALYEGGADEKTMNELKLWLLRQKQTQIWEDTPTTIEAIYGILLTGDNWLESKNAPVIKVGGEELATSPYIAFAKATYMGEKMNKEIGTITIEQKENHPGFGAAYWQYFENFNAIKQNGKELKVTKSLFKQVIKDKETVIEQLNGEIQQGDIVIVRLVIKADRDFEFVTLKDQRAACFEPVDQLSTYKWNEKLWYYLETKDATTNYFFEFLPKGTYVLEYKVKTTAVGNYNSGISSIQCMYAPEFVGNTQGEKVTVQK